MRPLFFFGDPPNVLADSPRRIVAPDSPTRMCDATHNAEMERAKVAFLAARTPYARRKALRKLEELRARSTAGLSRPHD